MTAPLAWVNLYGVNAPIEAPRLMSEVLWLGQTLADLQLLMLRFGNALRELTGVGKGGKLGTEVSLIPPSPPRTSADPSVEYRVQHEGPGAVAPLAAPPNRRVCAHAACEHTVYLPLPSACALQRSGSQREASEGRPCCQRGRQGGTSLGAGS